MLFTLRATTAIQLVHAGEGDEESLGVCGMRNGGIDF